jgi:hypothetical protein
MRSFCFAFLLGCLTSSLWSQPVVTSFPTSAEIGESVTIDGSGFNATATNNVVYFGGIKATITSATTSQLAVSVPRCEATCEISVVSGGLRSVKQGAFRLKQSTSGNKPTGWGGNMYKAQRTLSFAANPLSNALGYWAVADLDSDGDLDFVRPTNSTTKPVEVYWNTGASANFEVLGLTSKTEVTSTVSGRSTNDYALRIATGDLNNDGHLDLLVTYLNRSVVEIFKNNGNGTFTSQSTISVSGLGGANLSQIALDDVDRDGRLDFAVASLSNGTGSTTAAVVYKQSATTPFSYSSYFSAATRSGGWGSVGGLVLRDLNNDGFSDIAIVSERSWNCLFGVFYGTSTSFGTVTEAPQVAIGYTMVSNLPRTELMCGDLDADGDLDLYFTGSNVSGVVIRGSGSFTTSIVQNTGVDRSSTLFDANSDGYPDLLGSDDSYLSGRRNGVTGFLSTTSTLSSASQLNGLTGLKLFDANGDNYPDAFLLGMSSTGIHYLEYQGVATPVINTFGAPAHIVACNNVTSPTSTFTIYGDDLTGNVTVAAPSGVLVSTNGTTYATSVSITPSSGRIGATTVYVRLNTTSVQSISGQITISGGGATSKQVAVTGTVNPIPVISGTLATTVGYTTSLSASTLPNPTNPWTSSNTLVGTVTSSGVVSGLTEGSTSVTYLDQYGCTTSSTVAVALNTFYPKAAGSSNLSVLSNWSSNADGTGISPGDFSVANEFVLSNTSGTTAFSTGSNISSAGRWVIPQGATITLTPATTLTLSGQIVQTGSFSGGGVLAFTGSAAQTLGGAVTTGGLTVNNAAGVTLSVGATVNGNLTLTAGTLTYSNQSLVVTGSITRTSGLLSSTTGALTLSGSSAQSLPASLFSSNYENLVVANAAGVSLAPTTATISGSLTVQAGALFTLPTSQTLTLTGAVLVDGTVSAGTGSTLVYSSTAAGTFSGTKTWNNFTQSTGSGTVAWSGTTTINGALTTATGCTLSQTGSTMTLASSGSSWTNAGTFVVDNATININRQFTNTGIVSGTGSFVYNGTVSSTITGTFTATNWTLGSSYTNGTLSVNNITTNFNIENLTIAANKTFTFRSDSFLTITGTVSVAAGGGLDMGSYCTVNFNSSTPQTLGGANVLSRVNVNSDLTLPNAASVHYFNIASGKTITCNGIVSYIMHQIHNYGTIAGSGKLLFGFANPPGVDIIGGGSYTIAQVELGQNCYGLNLQSDVYMTSSLKNESLDGSITFNGGTLNHQGVLDNSNAKWNFSRRYFVTNGTGSFKRNVANNGVFDFHVSTVRGTNAQPRSANSVEVTNFSGAADNYSVRVFDKVYFSGDVSATSTFVANCVDKTWVISKDNSSSIGSGTKIRLLFDPNSSLQIRGSATNLAVYVYDATNGWTVVPNTTITTNTATFTYTGTLSNTKFAIVNQNAGFGNNVFYPTTTTNLQTLSNWKNANNQSPIDWLNGNQFVFNYNSNTAFSMGTVTTYAKWVIPAGVTVSSNANGVNLTMGAGAELINNGTLNFATSTTHSATFDGNVRIENNGTISTRTLVVQNGVNLINVGTITSTVAATFSTGVTVSNSGSITCAALSVSNTATVFNTGTITATSSFSPSITASLTLGGTVVVPTFSLAAGKTLYLTGTTTVNGNVTNTGNLQVSGTYTQTGWYTGNNGSNLLVSGQLTSAGALTLNSGSVTEVTGTLVTNGSSISYINAGSSMVVSGTWDMNAQVYNYIAWSTSGTLKQSNTWSNITSGTRTVLGTLEMDGTTRQTLNNISSTLNNLVINNAAHVILGSNQTVSGDLTFTAGDLLLNGKTVQVEGSTIGSSSAFPVASVETYTGSGIYVFNTSTTLGSSNCIVRTPVGAQSKKIWVGASGSATPVTIENAGTTDYYSVEVRGSLYSGYGSTGSTTMVVPRLWLITKTGSNASGTTFTFEWPAALNTSSSITTPALYLFNGANYQKVTTGVTVNSATSITLSNYTGTLSQARFVVGDATGAFGGPLPLIAQGVMPRAVTRCSTAAVSGWVGVLVEGTGLVGTMSVTTDNPTFTELSLTGSGTGSSTVTVPYNATTKVASQLVYLRMKSNVTTNLSGVLTLASANAVSVTVPYSAIATPATVWTGTGAWSTAGNWSCAAVPTGNLDVLISSGTATLSSDLSMQTGKTLTLSGGANLVIAPTYALTVNTGSTLTNAGTITLDADATGYGQLLLNGTYTASGSGVVVTKRLYDVSTAPVNAKWTQFSAPVYAPVSQLGNVQPNNLFTWDAQNNEFDSVSSTHFQAGKGYTAYYGPNGVSTAQSGTVQLSGTPYTSVAIPTIKYGSFINWNVQFAGSEKRGWNLIGNPLTSNLDFGAFTRNNLDGAFYRWDPNKGGPGQSGYHDHAQASVTNDNVIIPPMTAVWVRAKSAVSPGLGNGNITPATHGHRNGSKSFSQKTAPDKFLISVSELANSLLSDQLSLAMVPGASDAFEGDWDAWELLNGGTMPNVFADFNSEWTTAKAIDFGLDATAVKVVPVGVISSQEMQPYRFHLNADLAQEEYTVYLRDKLLNSVHKLSTSDYVFAYTSAMEDRFELILTNAKTGALGLEEASRGALSAWVNGSELWINGLEAGNAKIDVVGMDGRVVAQNAVRAESGQLATVTIPALPAGLYTVRVRANGLERGVRFAVQR